MQGIGYKEKDGAWAAERILMTITLKSVALSLVEAADGNFLV